MTRFALIFALTLTLAACETVKGAGRDLSTAGHAISTEAGQVQSGL